MYSTIFKLLPVACATAMLSACGGNDGGSTPAPGPAPVARVVPWASPAMILTANETSRTIALGTCSPSVQSATLVVNAAGDMIFSGAAGTTTVSEIHRINYATSSYPYVDGQNDADGPRAYIYLASGVNFADYIEASTYGSGVFQSVRNTAPSHRYSCSLAGGTTSFVLNTLPSSQRVASLMTSGITGVTTTGGVQTATFAGGVATWDNLQSGSPQSADANIRYVNLNVNTGAFSTSATPGGASTTAVITLPTTPTSTYAYFYEQTINGTKSFYVEVARPGASNLRMDISRVGNLLQPSPGLYSD